MPAQRQDRNLGVYSHGIRRAMTARLLIKRNGKWEPIQPWEFMGRTIGQMMLALQGKEAVGEVSEKGYTVYAAGTPDLIDKIKRNGKKWVMSFQDLHARLHARGAPLLDCTIPAIASDAVEIFGGELWELKRP